VWPLVAPILERALPHMSSKFSLDDIRQATILEHMQLWVGGKDKIDSAMVTEIINTPQSRSCVMIVGAGEGVDDWLPTCEEIHEWAEGEGCRFIEIAGRPGWVKLMKPYGYEYSYTVIKKELGDK